MEQQKQGKERYEKPHLLKVSLAAEEVLGIGCKSAPGGPGQSSPVGCGTVACSLDIGS